MNEKVNTWGDKLKNPAFVFMVIGFLCTVAITYNKVGETVEDQLEIKKELKDMHLEFDEYKIESIKRHYEIELKIKDETIARKDLEIEFYKNK